MCPRSELTRGLDFLTRQLNLRSVNLLMMKLRQYPASQRWGLDRCSPPKRDALSVNLTGVVSRSHFTSCCSGLLNVLAILTGFSSIRAGAESAVSSVAFPLRVSESRRFLADNSGKPFLVTGDAAWSLISQLNETDIIKYLDDRQRRGFNTIIVNLIEHKFASKAPANIAGVSPFLKPGDFAHPNPAYFDYAHWAVAEAGRRGISVWLCPAYLGWGGGDEGFFREIKAAGPVALRSYGKFVGARFKDLSNIVWMPGGDYALPVNERWTAEELVAGLHEGGATQIVTAHGGQTSAIETFGDQPWLAVDTVYRYQPDLWRPLRANYEQKPVRPFVLIETIYEGEHNSTSNQIRRQAWWAVLAGAGGQFFGNNPIWHFDGPGLFQTDMTWQQAMDSTGSRDSARLGAFLSRLPWGELVPDLEDRIVVTGRGEDGARVVAASTPDHRLTLIYVPAEGRGSRELTLSPGAFPTPLTARWFNPTKDADFIPAGPLLSSREVWTLRTPGESSAGANDWLLILEGAGPRQ
jgi:hypothetical protein